MLCNAAYATQQYRGRHSEQCLGAVPMQVLFFSTIIANLVGRTLPKWKTFAIKSPTFLMYLGFVKLAAAPLCFVYLKSGDQWHSDAGATGKPRCTVLC